MRAVKNKHKQHKKIYMLQGHGLDQVWLPSWRGSSWQRFTCLREAEEHQCQSGERRQTSASVANRCQGSPLNAKHAPVSRNTLLIWNCATAAYKHRRCKQTPSYGKVGFAGNWAALPPGGCSCARNRSGIDSADVPQGLWWMSRGGQWTSLVSWN